MELLFWISTIGAVIAVLGIVVTAFGSGPNNPGKSRARKHLAACMVAFLLSRASLGVDNIWIASIGLLLGAATLLHYSGLRLPKRQSEEEVIIRR